MCLIDTTCSLFPQNMCVYLTVFFYPFTYCAIIYFILVARGWYIILSLSLCPSFSPRFLKVSFTEVYASGFEFRTSSTLRASAGSAIFISREKIFLHRGEESSSPSAPFSRSPPLASNFNYTLPIGGNGCGGPGEASKRGFGTKRVARCSANISR